MPPGRDGQSSTSSSSSSSSSSGNDDDERFLPKSRKGWDGGDLEMQHQRESWGKEKVSAAVDIAQFQNHEVGKGYQAKHVVRQQSAAKITVEVKDMTGSGKREPDSKEKSKKSEARREKRKRSGNFEEKDNPRTRLQKYLACPAFISFRKEIEDILSS